MFKIFISFFIALFFISCASKNENLASQSVLVTLNTPVIKINDAGFLKQDQKELHLEVYKFGKAFFRLKIEDKICLNSVCYDKSVFNQKYFQNGYYADFLEDILRARPLYNAKNLEKTQCGFSQTLSGRDYEIFYELCDNDIKFIDKISQVRIRLKLF